MNVVHVFVCFSALSLDAAHRIASSSLAEKSTCLVALFAAPSLQSSVFDRVFILSPPAHQVSEWKKPFVIANWFRAVLPKIAPEPDTEIVAYVPHPFELPANHFVYSDPRVVRRELLPDGLLNYTQSAFTPTRLGTKLRYTVRVSLRRIAASKNGLVYRPLKEGHLTQYEFVRYAKYWTDNAQGFVTCVGEPSLLPRRTRSHSAQDRDAVVLVLDQELAPLVSLALEELLRATLVSYLQRLGRAVAYKAHPRGRNRATELAAKGLIVSDATGEELAETFMARRAVSHLVGFYSTPLLLSGDLVDHRECILPTPESKGVKNRKQLVEYVEAMQASGAHVTFSPLLR